MADECVCVYEGLRVKVGPPVGPPRLAWDSGTATTAAATTFAIVAEKKANRQHMAMTNLRFQGRFGGSSMVQSSFSSLRIRRKVGADIRKACLCPLRAHTVQCTRIYACGAKCIPLKNLWFI